MLKFEVTQQPDAIEKIFCEPFGKLKKRPLTDFEAEMQIKLAFAAPILSLPEEAKFPLLSMIEKRHKYCFTFKVTDMKPLLYLSIVAQSPGDAVMFLTYTQYWCRKNNQREIDFDIFTMRVFPMGYPSKEDLSKLWGKQKVESGNNTGARNLLDYASAAASIQFADTENQAV